MPLQDAFSAHEAKHAAAVLWDTWGHPEPGIRYPGSIVFTWAEGGDLVVIRSDFGDLDGGPWLHQDMQDYIYHMAAERGKVYRFDGYYLKFKNGNFRFTGTVKTLEV